MFSPDELTPCALGPTRAPADFGIPTFWDPPEAYLYLPNPTYHDCHTTSIDHGNQTKGWCKDPLPVPQRPPSLYSLAPGNKVVVVVGRGVCGQARVQAPIQSHPGPSWATGGLP